MRVKVKVRVRMMVNGFEKVTRDMNNTNTKGYSPKFHTKLQFGPYRCLKNDYKSIYTYIHTSIYIYIYI